MNRLASTSRAPSNCLKVNDSFKTISYLPLPGWKSQIKQWFYPSLKKSKIDCFGGFTRNFKIALTSFDNDINSKGISEQSSSNNYHPTKMNGQNYNM